MIALKAHGTYDYLTAFGLILCPFLFGFASVEDARNVFVLSGVMLTIYSLFSHYPRAILRVIPIGVHMSLDVALGVIVATAPWTLQYRGILSPTQEYLHYAVGLTFFALVGFTRERSETEFRARHPRAAHA